MAMFKLLKVGRNSLINEFRGSSVLQNGQYLQILGPTRNVVVSLILEPGYYLADANAMGGAVDQDQPAPSLIRTLR